MCIQLKSWEKRTLAERKRCRTRREKKTATGTTMMMTGEWKKKHSSEMQCELIHKATEISLKTWTKFVLISIPLVSRKRHCQNPNVIKYISQHWMFICFGYNAKFIDSWERTSEWERMIPFSLDRRFNNYAIIVLVLACETNYLFICSIRLRSINCINIHQISRRFEAIFSASSFHSFYFILFVSIFAAVLFFLLLRNDMLTHHNCLFGWYLWWPCECLNDNFVVIPFCAMF